MRGRLPFTIALSLSFALIQTAAGVEDHSASDIRFLRVLAPENRMKDWPLGGEKYLPISAEEFERLVAAMKPRDSKTPPAPSAAITSAQYAARLVGERLIGRATLDVTLVGPSRLMPLAPCNVAFREAVWDTRASALLLEDRARGRDDEGSGFRVHGSETPNLQIPKSANQGEKGPSGASRDTGVFPPDGPHPDPFVEKEETTESGLPLLLAERPLWDKHATIGSGSDGRLGVFVERSNRLSLQWSLAGRRDASDVLAFSFEIPAAAANQLFVELPNALMPKVDRGLIVGSEAVGEHSRRWQIELGGNDRLRLQVVSAGDAHPRRQLALLRESRTYDCSLRGLEVSAQWKLQVYNEPLDRISVVLDPELQLLSARLGDVAIPWSAAAMASGGTRVTLRLPEAIRDTNRVIRLIAAGRLVLNRPWRLPRVRAAGLLWLEGSVSLLVPEPLAADRIAPLNCAQTSVGPLSSPRSGQSMQFQSFDRDATVEVSLSRCPAKVDMLAGSAIELDGQQATARTTARFHISNDTRFAIEADVAPSWSIDSVESIPAGGVADWSAEPRKDGRQRLAIRLVAGLAPQQPVRLAIAARRPFARSNERLEIGDLPPLCFRGMDRSRQLVAVRPIGDYAMKVRGDERLKRFEPDDLVPSEAALLAAKPHDLLFERNDRSNSLAVSVTRREPKASEPIRRQPLRRASSRPVAPSAWIGDCRLESRHHSDGTVWWLATYNLENDRCNRLRLAAPAAFAQGELRGVRIDGVPAAWQTETTKGSRLVSVKLPAKRRTLCVTVEWTTSEPPLGIIGSLTATMPEPDVPMLTRHWIAWLPPGYESVGCDGYTASADLSSSAETRGWCGRCLHLSAGAPGAVRYARAASMQLFGAVVFLLAAGLGCWTAKKRVAVVLAVLLAVFAAGAMLLPVAYVPVAWGGLLGLLFCLALRWVHRNRAPEIPSNDSSDRAADANLGSTVPGGLCGRGWWGVLLCFVCCGGIVGVAVALPPPTPDATEQVPRQRLQGGGEAIAPSRRPIRGGSATATPTSGGSTIATPTSERPISTPTSATSPTSSPPLPTVDGKASAVARPVSSPPYRVFVPVDDQRKPVGGKVYVPEAFYQELYRHAAPVEKPPAWLIVGAVYRGDLTKEGAAGQLAVGGLRVQYDLRVFERATRVRIPLRTEGANLLPGSVLLDGRAIELEWEPDAGAFAFEAAEPGDYRLGLSLRPAVRGVAGWGGFDMAIPRVAGSRLELALPTDAPALEVPGACGGVSLEKGPPRLLAELGPTDRLAVRWQEPAAGATRLAVNAEQLTWLKLQPGSVVVNARFRFHVTAGELRQVQLAVDPRLRLLPMQGDAPPTVQIAAESGQTRVLTVRWPRPLSDDVVLDAAFLFNGASAVGNIPLPRIELVDTRPARRWMAVSIDTALDCEEQDGDRLDPLPVADFLKAWGQSESRPRAAFRLPRGETAWTLSIRPHEPRTTANQTLSLSFDEDRLDVLFDARLSVTSGYVFQHQVAAPKDFKIERVSLLIDRVDHVQRWSQDKDGAITVFLDGPASGAERLSIRGRMPIPMGEKCELPLFAVQKCRIQMATIQLFERPGVSLLWSAGVLPAGKSTDKTPAQTEAGETPALRGQGGRLVETIVWDGVRRPSVTVIAKPNRDKTDLPHRAKEPKGSVKSSNVSKKNAEGRAARTPSFVRSADVAIAWQGDGRWCGVAALDVELTRGTEEVVGKTPFASKTFSRQPPPSPSAGEQLDLRLPKGCELVQASVDDSPIATKPIRGGVWRLALAPSELPQRVGVIYRGVMPTTDAVGQLRFEPPTLGELPVRQTVWTVFLPPSLTAENPQGATPASNRPGNLQLPSGVAAIGGTLPPRYYLCQGGKAMLTLDCRPVPSHWPFHRWAAAVLLLFGMVSAGVFAVRVRIGRFRRFC